MLSALALQKNDLADKWLSEKWSVVTNTHGCADVDHVCTCELPTPHELRLARPSEVPPVGMMLELDGQSRSRAIHGPDDAVALTA